MLFRPTAIPDVVIVEPKVFEDSRGFFLETYQRKKFREAGISTEFVQDNLSRSGKGTVRGLHYQIQHTQAKLVRALRGEILDVAVDLRRSSPTFGKSVAVILSEQNRWSMFVPQGCAHGFCVISDSADVFYKCDDLYHPEHERTLLWNDPTVGIAWPLTGAPLLSPKDQKGLPWGQAETFE